MNPQDIVFVLHCPQPGTFGWVEGPSVGKMSPCDVVAALEILKAGIVDKMRDQSMGPASVQPANADILNVLKRRNGK